MGSKKTTTKSNETAVTTPNVPDYALGPVQNLFGKSNAFANSDPYQYTTPANAAQQQAFAGAQSLGTSPLFEQAANALGGMLGKATPLTTVGMAAMPTAANAAAQGYSPTMTGAAGLGPANMAGAANAGAANAGTANAANLAGYQAGLLGGPSTYSGQGYTAAQAGPVSLGNNVERMTGESLLNNFSAYLNPTTQNLVDATLSNYDDMAGRQRADQAARAAKAGAFGGSRYGIAESQLLADQGRNRALTEAELRNSAWNTAAGLSATDAGFRQQAGLANQSAANSRAETLAALQAQNNQFNAGARNDASAFGAAASNQSGAFNANAANQFGLAQFDANNTASQFNADAANTGQMFNADAANQFALANAGYQQQANLANAGFQQQSGLANQDAANQFALSGADLQQQANLANQAAANQASAFGAGAANTANLANMQAANQFGLAGFDAANQLAQFNAGAANQNAQFNAGQDLSVINALGGLANDMGANDRANIASQLAAGQSLWDIQNQYNQAPIQQLLLTSGLLNPGLIDAISGKTINSSGTSTSKQSGGLLGSLAGIASLGGAIF